MHGLDLFTGIGGITLAIRDLVSPVAYCEMDEYCQTILLQNMRKGLLPSAPIWDDIRTFQGPYLGHPVDIIYGGFPCQDISVAGDGKGLEGDRSGLFFEMLRVIIQLRPPFIFLENVPAIRTRGGERLCKELAGIGYDCRWTTNTASEFGAPHKRERWWLLGHTSFYTTIERLPEGASENIQSKIKKSIEQIINNLCSETPKNPWKVEPPVCGMDDGVPYWVDRIRALGNSVVPIQTRMAFRKLLFEHF